jgi:hypothetical protein
VTPAQGSLRHAPDAQPKAQVVSTGEYVQLPPPHVPGVVNARRMFASTQTAAGGELHTTVAHGSPAHAPAMQPNGQV